MKDEKNSTDSGDSSDTNDTEFLDRSERSAGDPDFVEPHERSESSASSHRYLIGEPLGEGGMAEVLRATDVQLNRPVAVKRLRSELAHREDARQRFFDEAEILAGLDHPGTTAVYDAGRLPDGDCFYAMKKVTGKTLRELMDERIPEDILDRGDRAHFVEIFIRLCQAVAAAHKQGVIHRDLKPENIMVDDLGVVFVMDWGLAKRMVEEEDPNQSDSGRTQMGAVMGTPAYMSPEQASGHAGESDRQADVFSLGVMLYELLTGVNPFRGETAVESMKGVMYHNPDSPRKRNPRIDRTISAITMKALDKDPFRRYRSAVELAEDVRHYREFLPVSAIDQTRFEKVANWSRRRPRVAAIVATLAVVAVLTILAALFQASLERTRVSQGNRILDEVERDLLRIETEINTLTSRMETSDEAGIRRIAHQLSILEAQFDAAENERKTIAIAITGYTILSPDDRAISVIRETTLDEISALIERGDYYRAQAEIQVTLRGVEKRNIFEFSDEEIALIRSKLTTVERELDTVANGVTEPQAAKDED
jgi:serine/threonine protein kinase